MPLDPQWKSTLPDARAQRSLNEKKHRVLGWMEEIFCVNCGRSGGMISKAWAAFCFYLCNDCASTWGRLPIPEIPESLVRSQKG